MKKFVFLLLFFMAFTSLLCYVAYNTGRVDGYDECVKENYFTVFPNTGNDTTVSIMADKQYRYIRISVNTK